MRVSGWESLLAEYLQASRDREFAWGLNDCALWAANWVLLATGADFLSTWKGDYATARSAARLMRERGFASVADIADRHLPAKPVALAARGDLVLHPQGALGLCAGRLSHFVMAAGLTAAETLACPKAWEVA